MMRKTPQPRTRKGKTAFVLGFMLFSGVWGNGQEAVTTLNDLYRQPTAPPQEQQVQHPSTEQMRPLSGEQSSMESLRAITVDDLLSSRKLHWQILGGASWSYNSNILSSQKSVSDQIFSPNCNAFIAYGDEGAPLNIAGNYGISYNQYQKYPQYDGLGQVVGLNGTWLPGERTSVTGALSSTAGPGSNVGSGVQGKSSNLTSSLGVHYKATEKISLGCNFNYNSRTSGTNPIQQYSDQNFNLTGDYQATSKFQVGIGIGGGMRTTTGLPDETDQHVNLRWNYEMTGKMSLVGEAGGEYRSNSIINSGWQPRFQAGWKYSPIDGTSVALSGYRHVDASPTGTTLIVGQVIGCNATVSQQILKRFLLSITGGVEKTQNDSPSLSPNESRSVGSVSLNYNLLRWMDGSVFYKTTSSRGGTVFDQTIYGVQLTAHY